MGFIVAPDAADELWIGATMERHEWLKGKPDVRVGYWTQPEWRDLEHLHQQHHRQQQQQQQQPHQQQHQQRQKNVRYRQQQQQRQQQFHLQQQHENYRRQHHLQHYQPEIAKKTSKAQQVEVRADGEAAPAKVGSAPPSSQTTFQPQPLSEYSAMMLSRSQLAFRENLSTGDELLESMENGLLRKPAQTFIEEKLEELVEESERPQESMHAAQPWLCSPVGGESGDEMGVLGKELVVAGGLVVASGGAGVQEQRPPFWEDSKISVWWPAPDETELEMESSIARLKFSFDGNGGCCDVDDGGVWVDGILVFEDGAQAPPPLLLQQQELLAPTPQEPWPPPVMAAEHEGSGAGSCGESRLELVEGGSTARLDFLFGDGLGGLGGGDAESHTTDGSEWGRAGIGTGRSCSSTYMGSGCEVAGRRLTRQRRARVRN